MRVAHRRTLHILRVVRTLVNESRVAATIRRGGDVLAALPLEVLTTRLTTDLGRLFRTVYEQGGDAAAKKLKARLVGKDVTFETQVDQWAFDVVNGRALRVLEAQGAARVVQITEATRAALRTMLTDMAIAGVPAQQQAKRIKQVIGLTEAHAQAVETLRATLTEQGVAPARAQTLTTRKANELLNLRALTIARTETIAALAAGQRESWQQAADEGLFEPATAMQEWNTAEDEATCAICEPMDGQQVPFGQPFTTGEGDEVFDPPAHVNCRCNVDLVL